MKEKTSVTLSESLCIANADSMYKRFLKALDVSNTIEVKASKVKKVDTAGLQIVIAVKRKLDKSGGQVIWSNPSEELVDSARILGFPSIFGLDD